MPDTILAVDLGGTKTAIARVTREGLTGEPLRMPAARTVEGSLAQVAAAAGASPCSAVAISLPGVYDPGRRRCWAPNLWGPDWQDAPGLFEAALGLPVFSGPATAPPAFLARAGWGPREASATSSSSRSAPASRAGVLAHGRPLEGAHGIAGAAGWMTLSRRWRVEYARCGCWEVGLRAPARPRAAVSRTGRRWPGRPWLGTAAPEGRWNEPPAGGGRHRQPGQAVRSGDGRAGRQLRPFAGPAAASGRGGDAALGAAGLFRQSASATLATRPGGSAARSGPLGPDCPRGGQPDLAPSSPIH